MRLLGDNTDAPGILMALAEAGVEISDRRAVILGAGGSARAAAYALAQAGAQVTVTNRTLSRAEELVAALGSLVPGCVSALSLNDVVALQARLEEATLLVNTTPVGMEAGGQHTAPLPSSPLPPAVHLPPGLAVLDLVYAPRQTPLLRTAAAAGCKTIEGLRVLVHQGALALECWTGRPAPLAVMAKAVED
jgi:shikimate dehydrogenase